MSAGFFTVDVGGMSGDGQLTAVAGAVAVVLLLFRIFGRQGGWTILITVLALAGVLFVGIYDWGNVSDIANDDDELFDPLVEVGWGLQAVVFGSIVGIASAIMHLIRGEQ